MKIFISYTVRDGYINKEILLGINENLRRKHDVFIDLIHNDSINEWQNRVENEIKSSDLVVLINTPNIKNSEWVTKEIAMANKYKIEVYTRTVSELLDQSFVVNN